MGMQSPYLLFHDLRRTAARNLQRKTRRYLSRDDEAED
jgi:hypothetical protein